MFIVRGFIFIIIENTCMKNIRVLKDIGNRVREIRKLSNLSQESLAAKANLDRTYIGGIERGERNVSILKLEQICKALGVHISDFFDDFPKK